jgi:ACR3 family arsenite transporter
MNSSTEMTQAESSGEGMDLFGRYLSVWVALAIMAGVALGQLAPVIPETLSRFEYAQVSIPIAILIWAMIFPMMAQIDFSAVVGVGKEPKGLAITTIVNWLIKPFTMFAIAWFFLTVVFELRKPLKVATHST